MAEQRGPNPIGHINIIGPFETFRDYNANVLEEKCKAQPQRAECRHRKVETKQDGRRVTRLAPVSAGDRLASFLRGREMSGWDSAAR